MTTKTALKWVLRAIACSMLGLAVADAEDKLSKPSNQYEQEMKLHGTRDVERFEMAPNSEYYEPRHWKVPHENLRAFYNLVGLPKSGTTKFELGHEVLHRSPESIKREVLRFGRELEWEIWRFDFTREEISWTTPFPGPIALPVREGSDDKRAWVLDAAPDRPGIPLGWDWSVAGTESLWLREMPLYSGVMKGTLLHWKLHRMGPRYVNPKLKLTDLRELAPWFYAHIPVYVRERADWFDFWETQSMAVYIYNEITFRGRPEDSPRMIEFVGRYAVEGKSKEKQFDTYFHPDDFRRIHIRGHREQSDLNLIRPCRECDVFVIDAPDSEYRIRFMVPAPKFEVDRESVSP
jgi:hypothetical protein